MPVEPRSPEQQNLDKSLWKALAAQNLTFAEKYLKQGAHDWCSDNPDNNEGISSLWLAFNHGYMDIIKELLSRGCNDTKLLRGPNSGLVLSLRIMRDERAVYTRIYKEQIIAHLVANGFKNGVHESKYLFWHALNFKYPSVAKSILQNYPELSDFRSDDTTKMTAFCLCVYRLCDAQLITAKDPIERTFSQQAIVLYSDVADMLIERGAKDCIPQEVNSTLWVLIKNKFYHLALKLLQKDLEAKDWTFARDNVSVLYLALLALRWSKNEQNVEYIEICIQIINILIARGAKDIIPSCADLEGASALSLTIQVCDEETALKLLPNSSDSKLISGPQKGKSCLWLALNRGFDRVALHLVTLKNAKDSLAEAGIDAGISCSLLCLTQSNLSAERRAIIRLLMLNGKLIDGIFKNNEHMRGATTAHFANFHGEELVLNALFEGEIHDSIPTGPGVAGDTLLVSMVSKNETGRALTLIQNGAKNSVCTGRNKGVSALFCAIFKNNVSVEEALMNLPDTKDSIVECGEFAGNSTVTVALQNKKLKIALILAKRGIQNSTIQVGDYAGTSTLWWSIHTKCFEVISILLDDKRTVDNVPQSGVYAGLSCLMYALLNHKEDEIFGNIIKTLLERGAVDSITRHDDLKGVSSLWLALRDERFDYAEKILANGQVQDTMALMPGPFFKQSVVDLAIEHRQLTILRALVKNRVCTDNQEILMALCAFEDNVVNSILDGMDHDGNTFSEFEFLNCPISLCTILNPVVAADGCLYDRAYIQKHINQAQGEDNRTVLSPSTREAISDKLIPSIAHRKLLVNAIEVVGKRLTEQYANKAVNQGSVKPLPRPSS